MKQQKIFIRIMAVLLALFLAASVLLGVISSTMPRASAVTQSQIDDLEATQEELEAKQQQVAEQINSLAYEQSTAIAKKAVLDEQIDLTQQEIDNATLQIEEYEKLIAVKEVEVTEAQDKQEKQWETYKIRMRNMEENGTISYFSVLFQARSFSDLLARLDYIAEIMEYDAKVYEQYNQARLDTIAAKEELEILKVDQETAKIELQDKKADLEVQVAEAGQMLAEIQNDMEALQALRDEYDAEMDALDQEIRDLIEELESQEQQNNSSDSVVGTGNFIWPSADSRYVTSLYGGRIHPILGYWKSHTGIDIAASYGTNVYAADGGTVIMASWNGGYGNCVMINHGNGYITLYGHMSSLAVSAGETVSQGETIGYVGSTGMSTGPHLHYEVYYNGVRTDPLQFYSNYTVDPYA